MNEENENPTNQKVPIWLWASLIAVTLIAVLYFSWYFVKGPGNADISSKTPVTAPDSNSKTSTSKIALVNVSFYPTSTKDFYSDQSTGAQDESTSACVITDLSGKTINATYKGKEGTVEIIKGYNRGCPSVVEVESGNFLP